jgi:UDP-N-acetylglucosamine 2-epimerase (non-hydrolysing)
MMRMPHGSRTDVALICGARPNFMKIAPLHRAIAADGRLRQEVVHTGQHHDFEMSQVFFRDLELPEPHAFLGTGSGSHAQQTARIMLAFEEYLLSAPPRMVVVVGDVDSTLACALSAAKCEVAVAHVEAGLRSFDRSMPEEINRIATDALSTVLYTTCDDGTNNLLREGIAQDSVCQVGNVMIDSLFRYRDAGAAEPSPLPDALRGVPYALVTLHRPSNVDRPEALANVVRIVEDASRRLPVVFPVHPRTRQSLERHGLLGRLAAAACLLPSQSYLSFLGLMLGARVVLTDSGGIQEETTALRVPCLTLRENTERPVTVELGTNRVVGLDRERVAAALGRVLNGERRPGADVPGWDGHAAERIAADLARRLSPAEARHA